MDWQKTWDNHAEQMRDADLQTQVMRTINKKPVVETSFQCLLADVKTRLQLCTNDVLLDLCCGNGAITVPLAADCKHVWGVDFCDELLQQMNKPANVSTVCKNVIDMHFDSGTFDKILMYAGLQYFDHAETVTLFQKLYCWLKPGGRVYLGDLPDLDRIWRFFDTNARKADYFKAVEDRCAIVGTWFTFDWLAKLAEHTGFNTVTLSQQKASQPYKHYRFDLAMEKANV